jgi:hypothetical protein
MLKNFAEAEAVVVQRESTALLIYCSHRYIVNIGGTSTLFFSLSKYHFLPLLTPLSGRSARSTLENHAH